MTLEELHRDLVGLQRQADALEVEHKKKSAEVEELKRKILQALEDQGLKSVKTPVGMLVRTTRFSVKLPSEPTDKEKFYEHLKANGAYEALRTVNYQALNSWYKQEMEAAKERGDLDFEIPGLAPPSSVDLLQVRK
jgi:hypothetical protein